MNNSRIPPIGAPDTNILLLLLVVQTDRSLLRNFKRVQSFTFQDIDLPTGILKRFPRLVTTPHILAETGNFVDQAPRYQRSNLMEAFRHFIATQDEVYEEARSLANREEFTSLGLSDSGLSSLSSRFTVITTDFALSGKILQAGGAVINFQEVRNRRLWPDG